MKRLELQLMQKIDALSKDQTFWPRREAERRVCESLRGGGYLQVVTIQRGKGTQRGYRADKEALIYRSAKALGLF